MVADSASRVLGVVAILLVFAASGAVLGSFAFGELPLDGITGQHGIADDTGGVLSAIFGLFVWALGLSALGAWLITVIVEDDDDALSLGWIGCGVSSLVGFFSPLFS